MTSYPEVSRNRRRYGVNHIVIDLITNAQDSITDGDLNNARQVLNVAKHLLSEINNGNLVGTVKRKGALK
jgi:hypothetical protein